MNSATLTPRRNLPKELREVLVVHINDPTAVGDSIELVNLDVITLDPEQFQVKRVSVPLEECYLIYSYTLVHGLLRSVTKYGQDRPTR